MKKSLLSVAALMMISAVAFGQFKFGAKAGVNLANFSGDDVEDTSMKIGYHIGVYGNLSLSDKLGLQPELLYSLVGAKEDAGGGEDLNYNLTYLTIPIMLVYNASENFNIQLGPQIGFLTKAEIELDGNTADIKDQLKGSDLGAAIGVGMNFGKLNAAARYVFPFGSIVDEGDADVKNSVIQISVGYTFVGAE